MQGLNRILRTKNKGLILLLKNQAFFSHLSKFATVDPYTLSEKNPGKCQNLVRGEWRDTKQFLDVIDPLNGEKFLKVAHTQENEIQDFVDSMRSVPKTGLHNPLKNPQRYTMIGEVMTRVATVTSDPEVFEYFVKLIQRVMPKSYVQARGEFQVTQRFFWNVCQDNPRFILRSFNVAGDHPGQQSTGYRFPFGPVALITPFNFPIEISALQLIGCILAGNKPLVKSDSKVAVVLEQFLRLLHYCGLPKEDIDFINCDGPVMEKILIEGKPRQTLFTGSSKVAERLAKLLHGKIAIEDAGFDWKILGPDVKDLDYVSWQSDQDAYACSGQKCSAQSIVFAHENWVKAGFFDKIKEIAGKRNLQDLTLGPVITWNNEQILAHIDKVLKIPGAKVLFGGKALTGHKIPSCYGAFEATAVYIPIEQILNPQYTDLCFTELFGPYQVVTEYKDNQIDLVLNACELMSHHLTAGVVSNDVQFLQKVLGSTVNGVTYSGIRARTTGAPQNHWFGPSGDPRGAGIGTPEAILKVWTCHREVIQDYGPIPGNWKLPPPS